MRPKSVSGFALAKKAPSSWNDFFSKKSISNLFQFVIFKPVNQRNNRTWRKGSVYKSSRPMSRLIRWYNKPGDITK